MDRDDGFYPLYLEDLTVEERQQLQKILFKARESRLFTQGELEEKAKKDLRLGKREAFSLRNFVDPKAKKLSVGKRLDAPHRKWVFLYNYTMTDLRELCLHYGEKQILAMIGELYDMGLRSGRYRNDMHLFNAEYLNLKSWVEQVEERFRKGAYIGFRYNSHMNGLVISLLTIAEERGRCVFNSILLHGAGDRATRGFVYQRGTQVYLFGFLSDDVHAEFYSLAPEDRYANTLNGLMSTVSNSGQMHAKQCFFVRMGALYGMEGMEVRLKSEQGIRSLSNRLRFLDAKQQRIRRSDGSSIPISRYLQNERVVPHNSGEVIYAG
jgi:hypothetical protein